MLGRTKEEIMSFLRIDTGVSSSQLDISGSPVSDFSSKQVSTAEADSPVPRGHEHFGQSRDTSTMHSVNTTVSSSPTRNHVPPEEELLAEITPNQGNLVDAKKRDMEPAPSTDLQPLSGPSTRPSLSHSHSPSIVNLGRRSVVRKRLAEMQRDSTSGTSPLRTSRRPAPHPVSHLNSREQSFGDSELEVVPEMAKSRSLVNVAGIPATAEQLMSPESSQVSPLGNSDGDYLAPPISATSDHATLSPRPKSAFRLRDEMHVHDSTLPKHHHASERSSSPTSTASHVGSQADGTAGALLDVIDVHAERQLIKTTELSDQLEAVQNDVRNVAANVRVAILGREEDSLHLAGIHTAVDDVRIALARLDTQQHDSCSTAITVEERLRSNQAEIFQALEEIQTMLKSSTLSSTTDGEAKPGLMTGEQRYACLPDSHDSGREHTDLTDIRQKLDMLVELSVPKGDSVSPGPPQGPQLDASQVRPIFSRC